MWNITAESADFWFAIFSWLLVAAAILVGVATYGVTVMGSAKEYFANERITSAAERAALANERAATAELELEKLKQQARPRQLNGEAFVAALAGKPRAPVEILFPRDDGEAFALSMQIRDLLKMAHWDVSEPTALSPEHVAPRLSQYPSAMGAGGQPTGVSVVTRPVTQDDFAREDGDIPDTPFKALKYALSRSLGGVSASESLGEGPPAGTLRVVVGPKPFPSN